MEAVSPSIVTACETGVTAVVVVVAAGAQAPITVSDATIPRYGVSRMLARIDVVREVGD